MKRRKFQTRAILIRSSQQVDIAKDIIGKLPVDPEHPLKVSIGEADDAAIPAAIRRYFAMVDDIADQVKTDGRHYAKGLWHIYLKQNVMPETIIDKHGVVRSKWDELPNGQLVVISIKNLSAKSMSDYMWEVEVYGSENDVKFHTNRG